MELDATSDVSMTWLWCCCSNSKTVYGHCSRPQLTMMETAFRWSGPSHRLLSRRSSLDLSERWQFDPNRYLHAGWRASAGSLCSHKRFSSHAPVPGGCKWKGKYSAVGDPRFIGHFFSRDKTGFWIFWWATSFRGAKTDLCVCVFSAGSTIVSLCRRSTTWD